MLYPRFLSVPLAEACQDTPVILVNGARQTGNTLVQNVVTARNGKEAVYRTLDDATALAAAKADPHAFWKVTVAGSFWGACWKTT